MALRNKSPKHSESFNLDNYLEEKSSENSTSDSPSETNQKKPSNFFRNLTLLFVALVTSVLWYYDWNPRAAIAGLVPGANTEAVILENPSGNGSIAVAPNSSSRDLAALESQAVEAARDAELERLELAGADIINEEELERLTQQTVTLALEATSAALEGLSNLDFSSLENLEQLEQLEQLENAEEIGLAIETALAEAFENIDFSEVSIETGVSNLANLDQYSRELAELNINQFSEASIRSLHEAGVPSSFLSQLNQAGLLERLDANEIIEIFQED